MTTRLAVLGAVLALAAGPNQAMAGYLTPAYEAQLEGWLGEGNLTFTPIFEKVAGDGKDSSDFHDVVDGKGRTITLIKVAHIKDGNGNILEEEQFVGGYNPRSWSSSGNFNITNDDADRTAFIFNLTDTTILRQKLSSDPTQGYLGAYQTYNDPTLGPVFGAGNDLETYGSLEGATPSSPHTDQDTFPATCLVDRSPASQSPGWRCIRSPRPVPSVPSLPRRDSSSSRPAQYRCSAGGCGGGSRRRRRDLGSGSRANFP